FTLYLPENFITPPLETAAARVLPDSMPLPSTAFEKLGSDLEFALVDDRSSILPGEKSILIIEDDRDFAHWLLDITRANGFKVVTTSRGKLGLELVREFAPSAIMLDLTLPDLDGWQVLDRLKSDLATRHIPVFVISARDEPQNVLKQGAL